MVTILKIASSTSCQIGDVLYIHYGLDVKDMLINANSQAMSTLLKEHKAYILRYVLCVLWCSSG